MDVKKSKKKRQPPKQFNVHRTLPNQSYQPTAPKVEKLVVPKKKRKFGWKKAILSVFLIILIPLLIIGIWDLRNFSRASQKMFGSGNVLSMLSAEPLEESENRVNILLIGYSVDDPGHAGAQLTDSIMVMSLDTRKKTGYMLSIPRDLYVEIPDYGHGKINEVYQFGETSKFSEARYSPGGAGLLEKTISENFRLRIHYHTVINYAAVRDMVDSVEGVTVEIKSSDPRGVYDPNFRPHEGGPLKLINGPNQLDGQTALRLTRARGATYGSYGFEQSDFTRTKHQQQVLTAIKQKINWKLVLNPQKNGRLFDAAANNIKTDVKIHEVLSLYRLFNAIPSSELKSFTLRDINGQNLLKGYSTRNGQSALIPAAGLDDYSDIQTAIEQLNR